MIRARKVQEHANLPRHRATAFLFFRMKGLKGFDFNLKCRDHQFEIGKEYEIKGELKIYENGFHFCESALDVFDFYPPEPGTRYCEIEATGETKSVGSISVTAKIKILREITLADMFARHYVSVDAVNRDAVTMGDRAHSATKGNRSHAATTGKDSHATVTGYRSYATTTGEGSHAATTGKDSHATTTGYRSHAATMGGGSHAATMGSCSHVTTMGYMSHATTTGEGSHATTMGNRSHATTTGYRSYAATTGEGSISVGVGLLNRVKSEKGWIVLTDWRRNADGSRKIHQIYATPVGGSIGDTEIKPNVWYWFDNGELRSKAINE